MWQMNISQKQNPPHNFRFTLIALVMYLPIIYALSVIRARWYGWALTAFSLAMLIRMRRSLLWRGFRMPLCIALAFMVAFGGLNLAKPEKTVSLMGQIGRESLRLFMGLPLDKDIKSGERLAELGWKPPEGYENTPVRLSNSTLELYRKKGERSEYAVLQLHGGAFEVGMNDLYRSFAVKYSDMLGSAVIATLDYRLFPEYGYPAQQDDAMEAWLYVTEGLGYPADSVICVGDSAGGNLVLSLGLRLRDAGKPLPRAMVCMSPWADLSNSGPSHLYNARIDPTFGVDTEDTAYRGKPMGVDSKYADGFDATDPYMSPTFGDYAGFPPMLLQAGGFEVLLSDSETVYDNCVKNGVDCTFTVYPGMFHVFQGSMELLPESRQAWSEIAGFLARVAGDGGE